MQEAGEVDGMDPPGPDPGIEEGNLGGDSRIG
jgi:hypothetical protein